MITEREKKLWDLLDDIDTAFDGFRPEMQAFENYVQRKVEERHRILVSDGHNLFEPEVAV